LWLLFFQQSDWSKLCDKNSRRVLGKFIFFKYDQIHVKCKHISKNKIFRNKINLVEGTFIIINIFKSAQTVHAGGRRLMNDIHALFKMLIINQNMLWEDVEGQGYVCKNVDNYGRSQTYTFLQKRQQCQQVFLLHVILLTLINDKLLQKYIEEYLLIFSFMRYFVGFILLNIITP
jgi:hypothetical protein